MLTKIGLLARSPPKLAPICNTIRRTLSTEMLKQDVVALTLVSIRESQTSLDYKLDRSRPSDNYKPDNTPFASNYTSDNAPFSSNSNKHISDNQNKKANLGNIVDQLKRLVPDILNESLPKSLISSNVILRISPLQHPYLPQLKGRVTYYTTCKTIQLILTSIVLNPKVKLHIQSIKVEENGPCEYGLYPETTKIVVKWTTCSDDCFHLRTESSSAVSHTDKTSAAKLGAHSWSKFDPVSLFSFINSTSGSLGSGLIGLRKEDSEMERIVCGYFVFELNENNENIIVHTVENVEILEKRNYEDINDLGLVHS